MSDLRIEKYIMLAATLGPENPLPPLGEAECLPHRLQDNYNRVRKNREFKAVILENKHLRAMFLVELGGRLWSLFHKPTKRELLYLNPVFQPANLAIRNAWFSGGVEWNVGVRGHATHTCSPLFAARVRGDNDLPVLRMYEWDRTRLIPYQIDAFLPDNSEFLFVRVNLSNPHDHEVPMYWWSNIAVPELPKGRVLAPAEQACRHGYEGQAKLVPVPYFEGMDQSYQANFNRSADCFYLIEPGRQPWIAALDESGAGLVQTSTPRLKGRKLFVWGMGAGGRHWQEFLSVPGSQYIEIQAGLAHTQAEYIPMPGNTEWTWLEAYGLMQVPPAIIHGADWKKAYEAVDERLREMLPAGTLEKTLQADKAMAGRAPDDLIQFGSGWGALERRRRKKAGEKPFCSTALIFSDDSLTGDQAPWIELLENGALPHKPPAEPPGAFMVQAEWRKLLEDALNAGKGDHWLSWLHLGLMRYHAGETDAARLSWDKSVALEASPWACRNLAALASHDKHLDEAAYFLHKACRLAPGITGLAIEYCQVLIDSGKHREMLAFMKQLPPGVRKVGRLKILEARAALARGDLRRVENILNLRPVIPDIREGEVSLSDLWFEMHAKRIAAAENIPVDDKLRRRVRLDFPPPAWLDFRQAGN